MGASPVVSTGEAPVPRKLPKPPPINVGGELLEKILVGVEERRSAFFTAVPDEDHLPGLLQDAAEFQFGFFAVEPVERLHGGDEIHPLLGKRRCLGRAFDGAEYWKISQ